MGELVNDFVNFGEVSRSRLGKQCQYGHRYILGTLNCPRLGDGLRFRNLDASSYHFIEIHKDDVEEFVRRYEARNEPK